VIADFEVTERILRHFMRKVFERRRAHPIAAHIRAAHVMAIGSQSAEAIKLALGSAAPLSTELVADVRGHDLLSGLPRQLRLSSAEVRDAIEGPLSEIMAAVHATLEQTPPELAGEIARDGILLAGGGELLRRFADRLRRDPRRQRRPCSRICSVMRRISTATGSSAGAAVTSLAEERFTPRSRLADFSVDRAHRTATTNATTTRIQKTAETRPTTSPTASLSATAATSTSTRTASTRLSIEDLADSIPSATPPCCRRPRQRQRGLFGVLEEPSAIHFSAPASRRGTFAQWSARRSRAASGT